MARLWQVSHIHIMLTEKELQPDAKQKEPVGGGD